MIYSYLTPFIPLSFKGEGEFLLEGASPLLNALLMSNLIANCALPSKERGGILKRGALPLLDSR